MLDTLILYDIIYWCQAIILDTKGEKFMFDKITEVSLLYDFYGQLLSKRQQEVMSLYYEENLSLSEIAEEFSISRQGVHDALKNAEKSLHQYEAKLGLVSRFEKSRRAVEMIDRQIEAVIDKNRDNSDLVSSLAEIRSVIDEMEQ